MTAWDEEEASEFEEVTESSSNNTRESDIGNDRWIISPSLIPFIYICKWAQTPSSDLISRNCDDGNGFVNPSAIDGPLPLPFPFIHTIECATTHNKL